MKTFFSYLFAILIVAFVMFALFLYEGWAIWLLWDWFIVPLGVIKIGIGHAIGISLLWSVFTHIDRGTKKGSSDEKKEAFVTNLIRPILCVIFGAIIHNYFL